MALASRAALLLLSVCAALLTGHLGLATAVSFFYNFSDPTSFNQGDLLLEGNAYAGDGSVVLAKGQQLTAGDTASASSAGRVSYRHPVHLWSSNATGWSFSTSFSFVIKDGLTQNNTGGGMAFFLAPYKSRMPLNSGGGYLGLFNSTTATDSERIVAVELDTHGDVSWDPTASPHIGVDLNTLHSGKSRYKVVDNLADGVSKVLQVDYSDVTKALVVTLRDFTNGSSVTLEAVVDLKRLLPQEVAIGFSAASVSGSVLSRVLLWSFNSNPGEGDPSKEALVRVAPEVALNASALPPPSNDSDPRVQIRNRPLVIEALVIVLLLVLTTHVIALLYCLSKWISGPSHILVAAAPPVKGITTRSSGCPTQRFGGLEQKLLYEDLVALSMQFSYQEQLNATENFFRRASNYCN